MAGEASGIEPERTLDCRGLMCPLPIVKTRAALAEMETGAILEMIATDPGSIPDIAAFCALTGNRLVRSLERDGEFVFYLRKA